MVETKVKVDRYTNRKEHPCGCVTVWDTRARTVKFAFACAPHRGYAGRFMAPDA
jgi:hypothetical protein